VGQYRKFLEAVKGDNDYLVRVYIVNPDLPEDLPMTGLPWGDGVNYCKWAGKSLPTEAQWERAARGPEGFAHPWGDGDAIWFQKRNPGQINSVKLYATDKSPFGIYDLAGNAREWCADWYRPDAFASISKSALPVNDWEGPRSAEPELTRVLKGGDANWKVWNRAGVRMPIEDETIGFRGVLTVE
jgi:formylglycine-generating enzyme required for sulfatase activity